MVALGIPVEQSPFHSALHLRIIHEDQALSSPLRVFMLKVKELSGLRMKDFGEGTVISVKEMLFLSFIPRLAF